MHTARVVCSPCLKRRSRRAHWKARAPRWRSWGLARRTCATVSEPALAAVRRGSLLRYLAVHTACTVCSLFLKWYCLTTHCTLFENRCHTSLPKHCRLRFGSNRVTFRDYVARKRIVTYYTRAQAATVDLTTLRPSHCVANLFREHCTPRLTCGAYASSSSRTHTFGCGLLVHVHDHQ